mmetsp:Transcript_32255/g.53893  ORF Transcript_32255/g.53893 Transcript_32255/m.53893 type:complete len:218 (+) Transcript_32255:1122-1775(+)
MGECRGEIRLKLTALLQSKPIHKHFNGATLFSDSKIRTHVEQRGGKSGIVVAPSITNENVIMPAGLVQLQPGVVLSHNVLLRNQCAASPPYEHRIPLACCAQLTQRNQQFVGQQLLLKHFATSSSSSSSRRSGLLITITAILNIRSSTCTGSSSSRSSTEVRNCRHMAQRRHTLADDLVHEIDEALLNDKRICALHINAHAMDITAVNQPEPLAPEG